MVDHNQARINTATSRNVAVPLSFAEASYSRVLTTRLGKNALFTNIQGPRSPRSRFLGLLLYRGLYGGESYCAWINKWCTIRAVARKK